MFSKRFNMGKQKFWWNTLFYFEEVDFFAAWCINFCKHLIQTIVFRWNFNSKRWVVRTDFIQPSRVIWLAAQGSVCQCCAPSLNLVYFIFELQCRKKWETSIFSVFCVLNHKFWIFFEFSVKVLYLSCFVMFLANLQF